MRTLLGHLAYRLGGEAAFAKVADQDRNLRGLVDDPARWNCLRRTRPA